MKEWGSMIDNYITGKTLVCVDTDQSRIVISSRPVLSDPQRKIRYAFRALYRY